MAIIHHTLVFGGYWHFIKFTENMNTFYIDKINTTKRLEGQYMNSPSYASQAIQNTWEAGLWYVCKHSTTTKLLQGVGVGGPIFVQQLSMAEQVLMHNITNTTTLPPSKSKVLLSTSILNWKAKTTKLPFKTKMTQSSQKGLRA